MPFRRSLCVLALVCVSVATARQSVIFSGPAIQQTPNPNAKRYTVTGTVFNSVTNEPIGHALVHLNGGAEQRVGFTGPDGKFKIANVLEGPVWVSAERPGFFDPWSLPGEQRAHDNSPSRTVGAGNNDFRLYLVPESKIVGTVLDSDGEPVEGVSVQVVGEQIVQGRRQWMIQGTAQTDENGTYRFEGQMPGEYLVCTVAKQLDPFARTNAEAYPGRCYPNSPDPQSGQAIDAQSGQTARADFSLELARTYSVSGIVTGSCAGGLQGMVREAGVGGFGAPMRINPATGRFIAHSVANGTWSLVVSCNAANKMMQTTQDVTVSGADVTGLQIALQPPVDIPVQVVLPEAQSQSGAPNINGASPLLQQLRLTPKDSDVTEQQYYMSRLSNENGEQSPQATTAVQNVAPGSYSVTANASGGCIASITYSGADVSREPLTITAGAGAQPIVVTLRSDCATLNITVQADRKDEEANVLIISDQPFIEPRQLSTQSGSTISAGSLAPGSYHVYAVSSVAGLAYADPQAMRDIPAQTVTLDPNARSDVTVPLFERGKP